MEAHSPKALICNSNTYLYYFAYFHVFSRSSKDLIKSGKSRLIPRHGTKHCVFDKIV